MKIRSDLELKIPKVQLSHLKIDFEAVNLLPPHIIRLHKVLPIHRDKNSITIAVVDPLNHQITDDVRMATGLEVIQVVAEETEIEYTIKHCLDFRIDPEMEKILGELKQQSKNPTISDRDQQSVYLSDDAPLIRMVNALLNKATGVNCSDIHIEPQPAEVRIRFRVDGELYEVFTLPKMLLPALVSRIKVIANMDIAERRIPQEGRFRQVLEGREIDFRVSTLPTSNGEKAVIRILDRANNLAGIETLGFSHINQKRLQSLCFRPQGMVLVTGATGSGKTTTLYSILSLINSINKNLITLEDPIEYSLPGVNQVQINVKAGLNFADGLGHVLRQDPDVIMVGEIRDHETARLAFQAALTGHLVLSTLHTNSATGTVARLLDMGIEKFLLASALTGVISQRLVRRLCRYCCSIYKLDPDIAISMAIPEETGADFFRSVGCNMCGGLGYQGRIALHEIITSGPQLRSAIYRGADEDGLQSAALEEGMLAIKKDGIYKAKLGFTSLEEVMKAVLLEG